MSLVAPPSLRPAVMALYRTLLRTANSWQAKDVPNNAEEVAFIRAETRRMFRENMHLTDRSDVQRCISEAEARLEIALHYRNPYPRPVHFPPKVLARTQNRQWGSSNLRKQAQARPVYVNTIDTKKLSTLVI